MRFQISPQVRQLIITIPSSFAAPIKSDAATSPQQNNNTHPLCLTLCKLKFLYCSCSLENVLACNWHVSHHPQMPFCSFAFFHDNSLVQHQLLPLQAASVLQHTYPTIIYRFLHQRDDNSRQGYINPRSFEATKRKMTRERRQNFVQLKKQHVSVDSPISVIQTKRQVNAFIFVFTSLLMVFIYYFLLLLLLCINYLKILF